jgi:hypothetical protein
MCFCIEKKIRLVFGWVFLEFVEVSGKLLSVSTIDCTLVAIERTCRLLHFCTFTLDRIVPVLERTSAISTNKPEAAKYSFSFFFIVIFVYLFIFSITHLFIFYLLFLIFIIFCLFYFLLNSYCFM